VQTGQTPDAHGTPSAVAPLQPLLAVLETRLLLAARPWVEHVREVTRRPAFGHRVVLVSRRRAEAEAVPEVAPVGLHVLCPQDAGRIHQLQGGVGSVLVLKVPRESYASVPRENATWPRRRPTHALDDYATAPVVAERAQHDSRAPPAHATRDVIVAHEGVPSLPEEAVGCSQMLQGRWRAPLKARDNPHRAVLRHPIRVPHAEHSTDSGQGRHTAQVADGNALPAPAERETRCMKRRRQRRVAPASAASGTAAARWTVDPGVLTGGGGPIVAVAYLCYQLAISHE